ncbi:MAG: methyl-accepting chemotaxis protein [Desulforhopalus sp.]
MKRCINNKILTVGMKILIGVALTSTICIGGLVYAFWQANEKVESNVNEVLRIRQQDSSHLRETIVDIQNKMLTFNQYLKVNPENEVKAWLEGNFNLIETANLEGSENWRTQFDRTQRRDLAKHKAVVEEDKGTFSVSFGLFQENGEFADKIEKQVYTLPENTVFAAIKRQIDEISSQASDGDALKNNLAQLGAVIADEALKAELIRTEILNFTEIIAKSEKELLETKRQNKRFIVGIGGIVCLVNLLVIFLLTRVIVERPLRTLIASFDQLRAGQLPEIPWLQRTDQIGVLAGAINNFKDALIKIKFENRRKQKEKAVIDETLGFMSVTINELEKKARNLNSMSEEMETIAGTTSSKSAFVSKRAENTATMTQRVADSTAQLRKSVYGIQTEVQRQNVVVIDLDTHTRKSQLIIGDLDRAANDINTIVTIVREISDQTKLLALNATIEAARAGEYGRGFAVVAREVKELSYETENATSKINEKIMTIEKVCEQMVAIINDINKKAILLHDISAAIENALAKQQHDTETIAQLVRNTSQDTRDVSEHIQQVRQAASQTMTISARVSEGAEIISKQLTNLLSDATERLQDAGQLEKAA